jgi:hypothetical protein
MKALAEQKIRIPPDFIKLAEIRNNLEIRMFQILNCLEYLDLVFRICFDQFYKIRRA